MHRNFNESEKIYHSNLNDTIAELDDSILKFINNIMTIYNTKYFQES